MMEFYSGVTNVITKVLLKSLSKHMTSNHYGEHFRCDKCDYHSAAKQSHERHTQYNHDGIKYTCGECRVAQSAGIGELDSSIAKDLIDSQDPKHTLFCREIAFASIYALSIL